MGMGMGMRGQVASPKSHGTGPIWILGLAIALVGAACASSSSGSPEPTSTTAPTVTTAAPSTTEEPVAATSSTAATPATTTSLAFDAATLTPDEADVLRQICLVANGEIPEEQPMDLLNTLFRGNVPAPPGMLAIVDEAAATMATPGGNIWDALAPLKSECDNLDLPAAATPAMAPADVQIQVGDLVNLTGKVEGCPPDDILAGEYWIGANGETWLDQDGNEWTVDLSVNTTDGDLEWSFSITQGSHRLTSYFVYETVFQAYLDDPGTALFETRFGDSLSGISGGWPDTDGFVKIVCG